MTPRLHRLILMLACAVFLRTAFARAGDPPKSGYRPGRRGTICSLQSFARLGDGVAGRLAAFGLQRSAEVEIPADLVWPFLTTEDGTLAPLVNRYGWPRASLQDKYPEWFLRRFGNQDPSTLLWAGFSSKEQRAILNEATTRQHFHQERTIQGLVLRADREHPFSGFQSYVEFGDESDVGAIRSFELHIRQAGTASEVAEQARRAAKAAGRDRQHLHVHLTFPLDLEALHANTLLHAARMIDFYRRVELFLQMMTILETNVNLRPNPGHFSILAQSQLREIACELIASGSSRRSPGKNAYGKSYAGFRSEGYYDQRGIWGLEVRAIHPSLSNPEMKVILDGLDFAGIQTDFGLDAGRLLRWMEHQRIQVPYGGWPQTFEGNTSYPLAIEIVGDQLTRHLLPPMWGGLLDPDLLFTGSRKAEGRRWFKVWIETLRRKFPSRRNTEETQWVLHDGLTENPSISFVLHPWGNDPLFYDNPVALEKVELAQFSALRKLARAEPVQLVVREFLQASGIYEALGQSIGIDVRLITP